MLGSRFDVYPDSIALKTIMTQQSLSRKQFRWVMELQEFLPFNEIHVSGKKNVIADALSRHAYVSNDSSVIDEALPVTVKVVLLTTLRRTTNDKANEDTTKIAARATGVYDRVREDRSSYHV